MPSDWWGIVDCRFPLQVENKQAAMSSAAEVLRKRMKMLSVRSAAPEGDVSPVSADVDHVSELAKDLNAVKKALESQGWVIRVWDGSVFRVARGEDKNLVGSHRGPSGRPSSSPRGACAEDYDESRGPPLAPSLGTDRRRSLHLETGGGEPTPAPSAFEAGHGDWGDNWQQQRSPSDQQGFSTGSH